MKWLPIILALVFFKLTVLPSCDSSSCCSEPTNLTDSGEPQDDGECSSFCMCLHCGYTTVVEQPIELMETDLVDFARVLPTVPNSYVHLYARSQWHPPLMG